MNQIHWVFKENYTRPLRTVSNHSEWLGTIKRTPAISAYHYLCQPHSHSNIWFSSVCSFCVPFSVSATDLWVVCTATVLNSQVTLRWLHQKWSHQKSSPHRLHGKSLRGKVSTVSLQVSSVSTTGEVHSEQCDFVDRRFHWTGGSLKALTSLKRLLKRDTLSLWVHKPRRGEPFPNAFASAWTSCKQDTQPWKRSTSCVAFIRGIKILEFIWRLF